MRHAKTRHARPTPQPCRPAGTGGEPSQPSGAIEQAVDRERLIWDPEYRREIARLLREAPPRQS